ncbi:voltage-gated potassium channel [Haloplanus vescus]|uniref:Voltage-gated potassium channel n=1 Tax=Haloplanus vescus TaxID=555874 RepID=A0A1H4AJS0_9EURY|nr:NAD-binding protein [Haloplanus vescus]SEA36155.1 voltage-gated potassium channel [Haloplanus vescus]
MAVSRGDQLLGVRAAVGLTLLAGALSMVTGLVHMGSPTGRPLVPFVPPVARTTAGFTGTLTGFLLLGSALGLRRGLRSAWYSTLCLLVVSAAQGLIQASETSVPLVVLSVLALPAVALNRRRFDRTVDFSASQIAAFLALGGSQVYITTGAYALNEQFNGLDTLVDALYFSIVTSSTVGYGDITPDTAVARLFAISALVVGTASFAIALGVLLTPAIEARLVKALGKMSQSELDLLDDHILVLGYGDLTEALIQELNGKAPFLVIVPDEDISRRLSERGVDTLVGDTSDEATLQRVHIEDARAVVAATNDDGADALAVLTARQLAPDVHIVAAATQRENVDKLRRAGADTVISPASIGSHLLVESALGGRDVDTEAIADRLLDEI